MMISQLIAIAKKDIQDALRTRTIFIMTGFLLVASMVSIAVTHTAMGGRLPSDYSVLEAMRGFVEHLEIIGSALAILLGYRSAANERGHNTLALVMTRPIRQRVFLAGKVFASVVLICGCLTVVFVSISVEIMVLTGVGLSTLEVAKLAIGFASTGLYMTAFFLLGFLFALHLKHLSHALLTAFSIWLVFVLIAPQIGDTLDPDNQAVGGLFSQLSVPHAQEVEIMNKLGTYEVIRTGIEQLSPSKHFERLTFALWGIKGSYIGMPLSELLSAKIIDILWLLGYVLGLGGVLFKRQVNFTGD
ncbi:MAG: ABC transporter permease [Magnetovibrio sp.]|nr:ABC transporter permease [Magnetovibrio sp.]